MHMGNTQSFQMLHTDGKFPVFPRYGKRFIFPAVSLRHPAFPVVGKIFDMQLVDNPFIFFLRRLILGKPLRVGQP